MQLHVCSLHLPNTNCRPFLALLQPLGAKVEIEATALL